MKTIEAASLASATPLFREPRIWALLGAHQGDNNQALALAEALGLPFETKLLQYNQLRRLQPRLIGASLLSVTRSSRECLAGDPPDLTISTGHRSVPVVQALRHRSGGWTRSVHLGYPRLSPARFDLVVTTPEYPVPDHPNVMRVPLALTRAEAERPQISGDDRLLDRFPVPRRLLILGGPSLYWTFETQDVLDALSQLLGAAAKDEGSVLVVGSPRTPPGLLDAVQRQLAGMRAPALLAPLNGPPSYSALLDAADQIFVTADSVAMASDAIMAGKPVSLVPVRPTRMGQAYMRFIDRLSPGQRIYPRDLPHFWRALEDHGLAGSLEQPRTGPVPDLAAEVAQRVRAMLG